MGESLGLVTDKAIHELREELDCLRATWMDPERQQEVSAQIQGIQVNNQNLEVSIGHLSYPISAAMTVEPKAT